MNLIEEAKALGFSDAAVISTDQLVFVPEYRVFCEDNLCGNYDKNPACPPQSGTVAVSYTHLRPHRGRNRTGLPRFCGTDRSYYRQTGILRRQTKPSDDAYRTSYPGRTFQ